jgi:hypothetical protein
MTEPMDLHQLDELVRKNFSAQQLDLLRTLPNSGRYRRVEEVPQGVWLSLLERVRIQFWLD